MHRTCTLPAVLLGSVAALALGAPADDKPAAPAPAKLERKNYTETAKGLKLEVVDPDATPPKTKRVDLTAKFDMVWVPGGEFEMGSPETESGRDPNEGPRHKVKVDGFWMAKCETTWDEFDAFWFDETYPKADETAAKKLGPDAITRPTNTFVDATYGHERDGHPAICMTHHAAMMYCEWLRKKTGRAYRLPTEAEWEYAARGGKGGTAYFFGDDPEKLEEYAWFKTNSPDDDRPKGTTHKVGTRKPSPFGLYDLYGNVSEWTLDQFDAKAYEARAKNPLSLRPVTAPPTTSGRTWSAAARGRKRPKSAAARPAARPTRVG